MNRKNVKVWLFAAAVVVAIGIAGSMDFADEVREQLAYCDNVKAGVWPDYAGTYKAECTPERIKELENILR